MTAKPTHTVYCELWLTSDTNDSAREFARVLLTKAIDPTRFRIAKVESIKTMDELHFREFIRQFFECKDISCKVCDEHLDAICDMAKETYWKKVK